MQKLGLQFSEVSNPESFEHDPKFGWGFFGHRYNLYSSAIPHEGYNILLEWSQSYGLDKGTFVFTSNVDGQFHAAGFPQESILECHGSIHYLQCHNPRKRECKEAIWESKNQLQDLYVDPETFLASEPLPQCIHCERLASPNILMFK